MISLEYLISVSNKYMPNLRTKGGLTWNILVIFRHSYYYYRIPEKEKKEITDRMVAHLSKSMEEYQIITNTNEFHTRIY